MRYLNFDALDANLIVDDELDDDDVDTDANDEVDEIDLNHYYC